MFLLLMPDGTFTVTTDYTVVRDYRGDTETKVMTFDPKPGHCCWIDITNDIL